MNKKGQVTLGTVIMVAVAVIVGAIFLVISAQQIGDVTNTRGVVNATLTGTNATNITLDGKYWDSDTIIVFNATGDYVIGSGNWTLYNNQVVNGVETALLEKRGGFTSISAHDWLITGTYQPTTYAGSSGTRSIANIIVILFALAIAVVALSPTLRNEIFNRI